MTAREQALSDIKGLISNSISYGDDGTLEVWNINLGHIINRRNYFDMVDNLRF